MNKIFFYGDSGNKNSVLQAYRAAYRSNIIEVNKLVTDMANHILANQYDLCLPSSKNDNNNNTSIEYSAPIYKQLRQNMVVCNYYYEHSRTDENRLFRCFMSLCTGETKLILLAHKLADYHYQEMMATDIINQAQNS